MAGKDFPRVIKNMLKAISRLQLKAIPRIQLVPFKKRKKPGKNQESSKVAMPIFP